MSLRIIATRPAEKQKEQERQKNKQESTYVPKNFLEI